MRLDVDRNGQVTSRLMVERPETLRLLRRDAPQMQRALQDAGLKTSDPGCSSACATSLRRVRTTAITANPNAHRLVVGEDETIPATVASRSYGRMLGASGGVDIRV